MEYQDRSSRPLLPKQAFRSAGKHNRGSILPLKMIFPGFLNRIIEIASVESSEQALSFVLAVSEFPRVRNHGTTFFGPSGLIFHHGLATEGETTAS